MRILFSALFFFTLSYAYSQNVADTLVNRDTTPTVTEVNKITYDSHIDVDTIKNNKKFNVPKAAFKKIVLDSKDFLKRNNVHDHFRNKDTLAFKPKKSDSTLTEDSTEKFKLPDYQRNPLSAIRLDSTNNKISLLKIDSSNHLLTNKKNTSGWNNILPGNKQGIEKLDLKGKGYSVKNGFAAKKDSLFFKGQSQVKSLKPSAIIFFKKQLKTIQPKGTVSIGYEYGVLPFVASDRYPSGGYKAEGRVSFLLLNVPLELMFSYTDIKNVIGINNYFRISYDADRYKEQLAQKLDLKSKLEKEQLGKLELKQQQLLQKIEYLRVLKEIKMDSLSSTDGLKSKLTSYIDVGTKKDSLLQLPDTSGLRSSVPAIKLPGSIPDTSEPGKLTGFKNKIYTKKDSIEDEYNKYKSKYDTISHEINKLKDRIHQIENIGTNSSSLYSPYLSKVQRFLSGIKKFEIGLCHPSYSTFLVNNIPLQGINLEYSKNNNFLAVTYGTTVNTLLYNTKTLQGTLQGVRNMYNYFDFGNLSSGRKILSLKGGIGAKEGSHLYVGFMLGRGRTDYLLHDTDTGTPVSKETNVVLELDAKYKFTEHLNVDVILGKSSVKEGDLTMDQISKSINEIFSNHRSYALLTRLNADIKKTNTKLTFTARWVDPYFKSFGIGFLRSDNLRYEIKAEQPITKKIKYSIAYRREEDNLLKLYDYKNTLQSINNSLYIKLNHQFNIRLNYIPLFRELRTFGSITKDRNQIATAILSYTPKVKKISSQFNLLYSKYIITGDSSHINFENFTYTHQFQFQSGFKTGLTISWFRNNLKDTLNNDTYLGVLDVGYVAKSGASCSLGGKMAYKKGSEMQYGFIMKVSVKLYKGLFGEVEAEKILIGDYYNSFIVDDIKKFPYYCNARLVFNF